MYAKGHRYSQLLRDCVLELHHAEMELKAPTKDLETRESKPKMIRKLSSMRGKEAKLQ